jgi:alkanesulfonate monooxygenase SsuD/methylene tetrahydromethanopterin reductase-like flavin-dependent oxidoreductase (luciferase family)
LAKPPLAAEIARRFYESARRAGFAGRRMGVCRFVVVGESDREAKTLAARAYPVWHQSFFELFRRFEQKPVQTWSGDFEVMEADGLAIAGSPERVAQVLGGQLETVGANYLVSQLVFGDMSVREAGRSIDLFASRVMPALRRRQDAARLAQAVTP